MVDSLFSRGCALFLAIGRCYLKVARPVLGPASAVIFAALLAAVPAWALCDLRISVVNHGLAVALSVIVPVCWFIGVLSAHHELD